MRPVRINDEIRQAAKMAAALSENGDEDTIQAVIEGWIRRNPEAAYWIGQAKKLKKRELANC